MDQLLADVSYFDWHSNAHPIEIHFHWSIVHSYFIICPNAEFHSASYWSRYSGKVPVVSYSDTEGSPLNDLMFVLGSRIATPCALKFLNGENPQTRQGTNEE